MHVPDFDDDATVVTSNTATDSRDTADSKDSRTTSRGFSNKAATDSPIPNGMAIADSGTTGHFVRTGALVKNIRPTRNPVRITIPNGDTICSTHECNLDIPWLPDNMTKAHMVPDLAHASLISIKLFCEGGASVMFDQQECLVYHQGKLVLAGTRDETTGLWTLPIAPTMQPPSWAPSMVDKIKHTSEQANQAYTMPTAKARVKYMHQSLFSPPTPTLLKAVCNN